MSQGQFLEASAKQRTADTVRAVEAQTAVEVVVAVRRRASRHLGTCAAFGLLCGAAGFAFMWFSPQVYDVGTMPLDAAITGWLGSLLCAAVAPLRRMLTPGAFLRRSAERAAAAAFSELGIGKTSGKTGLLVYVALFERSVCLVPDSGIPAATVTGPLANARQALSGAVGRADLDAFLGALLALGPACGAVLPRRADDVNELRDDVA